MLPLTGAKQAWDMVVLQKVFQDLWEAYLTSLYQFQLLNQIFKLM